MSNHARQWKSPIHPALAEVICKHCMEWRSAMLIHGQSTTSFLKACNTIFSIALRQFNQHFCGFERLEWRQWHLRASR